MPEIFRLQSWQKLPSPTEGPQCQKPQFVTSHMGNITIHLQLENYY